MIVTAEDERYGTAGYGLDFFANSPAEGILNDIVYGDDLDELMVSSDGESNEGLFYLLYRMKKNESGISTGIKIGSGTNEYDFIDFAKNEEGTEKNKMFDATVALFKKLWGQYASKEDGLYIGNKTY